jgi:Domain of unknown function (DUF4185)
VACNGGGGLWINPRWLLRVQHSRVYPPPGPFVLMWGSGNYRHSDAYLAIVPASQFESGRNTLYFGGLDATGMPVWKHDDGTAEPIITNGTIGDVSVTWCAELGLWLMTYDSRAPARAGILFSYSRTPWGPWSSPQLIFNASRDHAIGRFIHDPQARPDDGLAGPVIGKGQDDPRAVHGGSYAPYLVEPWTKNTREGAVHLLLGAVHSD